MGDYWGLYGLQFYGTGDPRKQPDQVYLLMEIFLNKMMFSVRVQVSKQVSSLFLISALWMLVSRRFPHVFVSMKWSLFSDAAE